MSKAIDPVTFAVIKNAMDAIVDEVAYTVLRTARSEIVKDVMDYSAAICDAQGRMIAQANKEEQTIAIRRGELVERADVKLVFARVYTIIGSQVKTLSEKLGPDIAAALGVTEDKTQRVQELMSIDILRALNQIKKEFNTFLDSIGEAVLGAE